MKRKLIILPLIAAMFMTGCKEEQGENTENNQNNTNENTNNGENENNNNNGNGNGEGENTNNGNGEGENGNGEGGTVKPPVIITNNFEEALKKNYKNMTVDFALASPEVGEEGGKEYYAGNK